MTQYQIWSIKSWTSDWGRRFSEYQNHWNHQDKVFGDPVPRETKPDPFWLTCQWALPDTPNQTVAIWICVTEFTSQNFAASKPALSLFMAHEVKLKKCIEMMFDFVANIRYFTFNVFINPFTGLFEQCAWINENCNVLILLFFFLCPLRKCVLWAALSRRYVVTTRICSLVL